MAALGAQTIASSYEQLLHTDTDGGGNGNTLVTIKDGDNGTTFGIKLATNKVEVIPGSNDANAFEVSQADGTAVFTVNTSSPAFTLTGDATLGNSSSSALVTIKTTGSSNHAGLSLEAPASGTGDPYINFKQGSGDGSANNMNYQLVHDTSEGYFKFRSADSDGSSTDADIWRVVDGTDDFIIPSGKLGIGTTSPSCELDVRGGSGDTLVRIVGYEGNHAGLELWGDEGDDSNDGVQLLGAAGGDFSIRTSKTANLAGGHEWDTRLFVKSDGNVGIGTTSPDSHLHIKESSNGTNAVFHLEAAGASGTENAIIRLTNPSDAWDIYVEDNTGSGDLRFYNGADRVTIQPDGKVGIGDTSPETALKVEYSQNDQWVTRLVNTNAGGWGLKIEAGDSVNEYALKIDDYDETNVLHWLKSDGTAYYKGNVGISETSPSTQLVLKDGQSDAISDIDTGGIGLRWNGADGTFYGLVAMDSGARTYNSGFIGFEGHDSSSAGSRSIVFATKSGTGDSAVAKRMEILGSGHVGIGITPTSPLHVYSSGEPDLPIAHIEHGETNVDAGDEILRLDASADADIHSTQLKIITIHDGGGEIGKFVTASNGNINTAWTNISDVRLKKDIQDTSLDGLGIINAIKLRDFKWNAESGKYREDKQVVGGLIADEVYEVYKEATTGKPGAVKEDGSIDRMGVTESQFITVLMKAVQELSAKVEALESA